MSDLDQVARMTLKHAIGGLEAAAVHHVARGTAATGTIERGETQA